LPVGCHWQSSHPLKERIEMLKQPLPARTRKIAGSLFVATIVGCGTWAAWAAQPAQAAPTTPTTSDAPLLTQISAEDELTPPEYPKGAMANGKADIEGKVDIEVLVGADGHVKDVKILKADPAGIFEQATIAAAKQWKLKPATRDGRPVEGRVRTQVEFRRDEKN
jgi:TonB family protein